MNISNDNIFIVPDNLFESDLLCFLNPRKIENEATKEIISLLHKICHCKISEFGTQIHIKDLSLTDNEYKAIENNGWHNSSNLEIKARCCDLLRKKIKDKRKITVEASNAYIDVFRSSQEMEYLERAVTVRDFK